MKKKNGQLVLFCLEEYLKGEGAGFWSNELGWTTEESATRFIEEEMRSARKPMHSQCEWISLPSAKNRKGYLLRATNHVGQIQGEMFFWAPDADHAREQARDRTSTKPEAKTWVWRVVSVNGVPVPKVAQPRKPAPAAELARTRAEEMSKILTEIIDRAHNRQIETVGRRIFLITKTGPEWQYPVEAWPDEKRAKARADELNGTLDPDDAEDRFSRYEVVPVALLGD